MTAVATANRLTAPSQKQGLALPNWLRVALQFGLTGGLIEVSIALLGMPQAFSVRDILSGVISMSQALLLGTLLVVAYTAVSRSRSRQVPLALLTGACAGLVASAWLVALIALGNVIVLGEVFINATPTLYQLLIFGTKDLTTGSLYLLAGGLVLGVVAGVLYLLPSLLRGSVVAALSTVVILGVLQELIRVTLSTWEALSPIVKFLYESNGLSIAGAVSIFVVVAIGSSFWKLRGAQIQGGFQALPAPTRQSLHWGSMGVGVVLLLLLPIIVGLYLSEVLNEVGRFLLMGLGLNIVVGFAGLLDLGYVAFFAIGAYTVGVLTSPEFATGVIHNWWIALPFAVIMAAFAGIVLGIPVLKMRGDYLAIVTLGFGEIIRLLAISDFLKPWIGGAQGIQGIVTPDVGPIQFVQQQIDFPLLGRIAISPSQLYYYVFLAACVLVIFIANRVKISRVGRAWMAVREDEDVAQAMGIDLVVTKLLAFSMGASFGGLAGAIFASKLTSVYPHSFNFLVSINVLSVIIVGGMGSIPGVIIGALVLVGLPELTREFADFRYLFYGMGLVIMMLTRPEGLVPEARRAMELEEFKETEAEPPPVLKNPGIP